VKTLPDWLRWQESLHLTTIDLGLERIREVASRLGLLDIDVPLITVAGTNGKGSTVTVLAAILQAADYRVGAYTSPHILHYNERIAVDGVPVADADIVAAFEAIEAVRQGVSLTYFEFGTLAAMWIFRQHAVQAIVLEVGLGGRLDATNLWDADVAVITAIGIDHVDWLGDDREVIGREKAGIARAGRPMVCGDPDPPASIAQVAAALPAPLLQYGRDFRVEPGSDAGTFSVLLLQDGRETGWRDLPLPTIGGTAQRLNVAHSLVALSRLGERLPMPGREAIVQGIGKARLAGRLQKIHNAPDIWIDVAHNPHAAEKLAEWLKSHNVGGRTLALFSMLGDKDIAGVVRPLLPLFDEWHYFPLLEKRGASLEKLEEVMLQLSVDNAVPWVDFEHAWAGLNPRLNHDDRLVVFGSFLVVSSMLEAVS